MANAIAPLDFTDDQRKTVRKLALMMNAVAAVLLLVAGINVVGGVLTLVTVSPTGILAVVEGLITGLLGLIMLSSATDVRFAVETKYTSIHLGHTFRDLAVFYMVQFSLALFLILVTIVRLFVG